MSTQTDLEDAGQWDFEHAERRPGVKGARAVVSVAFSREDFQRVVESASQLGLRTSEFIREAALERAYHQRGLARLSSYSRKLGLSIFTDKPLPTTRVSGAMPHQRLLPEPTTTSG